MMHALMTRVQAELAASHAAVAWLGGRHDRYSKYGWEWGGNALSVSIDAKSAGPAPAGWTVRSWVEADVPFERLWALRQERTVRGICDEAEWRLKMRRSGSQTWIAERGGRAAYMVFNPGWQCVQEWGGDPDGLLALLSHAAQSGAFTVLVHPELEPELELFRRQARGVSAWISMLSVIDLQALAEDYAPFFRDRLPAGRAIRLAIRENGATTSAVTLAGTGRAAGGKELEVTLDRCRMTSFVFGPVRASHTAGLTGESRWVDQVFPLPFIVPNLFSV